MVLTKRTLLIFVGNVINRVMAILHVRATPPAIATPAINVTLHAMDTLLVLAIINAIVM